MLESVEIYIGLGLKMVYLSIKSDQITENDAFMFT